MVERQRNVKFSQNCKFGQNSKLAHSCVRDCVIVHLGLIYGRSPQKLYKIILNYLPAFTCQCTNLQVVNIKTLKSSNRSNEKH